MKALIKVASNKSNLKFNQLEAYRALTISDVNAILEKYSDIDMLIFEEVQTDEITKIKDLANRFRGRTYTFGKVKLEDIENYTSLSDIQDALDKAFSLETRTYGRFREPVLFTEVYDETGNLYVEKKEEELVAETITETQEVQVEIADTQENISIVDETPDNSLEVKTETQTSSKEIANDMFDELFDDMPGSNEEPVVTDVGPSEETKVSTEEEQVEDLSSLVSATTQAVEVPNDMFSDADMEGFEVATPVVVVGKDEEEETSVELPHFNLTKQDDSENIELLETVEDKETVELFENVEIIEERGPVETSKESEIQENKTEIPHYSLTKTDEVSKEIETQEFASQEVESKEIKTEDLVVEDIKQEDNRPHYSLTKTDEVNKESEIKDLAKTSDKPVTLVGELRPIVLEPVLDLSRLDSFNALVENSKDLVSTMYNELCYYRDAISKLSNEENVQLMLEEQKGKVDNTLLDKANENIKLLEDKLRVAEETNKATNNEVKQLEIKIESANVQFNTLKSKYESSELKNRELQNSLNDLQAHSSNKLSALQKELVAKKDKLEKELEESKLEVEKLNKQIEVYVKSSSSDRQKLDKATSEKQSLYSNYLSALQAISTLSEKYITLLDLHNKEVAKVKTTVGTYQQVLNEKVELEAKITDLELQKRLVENKINETERVANLKISEFTKMQETLKSQLEEANSTCTTLNLQIDSLNARVATADRQKQSALTQVDDLLEQISDKNALIENKDTIISQITAELTQLKEDKKDAFQLQEQVQVADMASQNLQKEIGKLQIEVKNLQSELDEKNKKIGSLARANSDLKISSQALAKSTQTNTAVDLKCNYSGHAFIYPVFGSGSYGVTTTAVSIAKKLHDDGNSVLLMDMDLVTAKCNGYLKQPPLLPQEIGMAAGLTDRMSHSCLGILMHKGVDYFIHESSSLLTQIAINKRTRKPLDYFSGLYTDMETYKFISIDWTELLNTLGNHYDYIVVDLGRFGGSPEQNSLIKMFYTICIKYLVITTRNDDDLRMMMLKLSRHKLLLNKAVWMINMAPDTKLTQMATKITSQVPCRIVTFAGSMYGTTSLFTDALFRGQFTAVVDELVGK